MGIPDHLTCLLRNLYAGRKQQLELDMEQQTGSKEEKEYVKVVYCHRVWLFATPWTAARQASLSITNSWSYSNSCQLSWWFHPTITSSVHPLLLLPSIFPSIRVFSNESALCIRWPNIGVSA